MNPDISLAGEIATTILTKPSIAHGLCYWMQVPTELTNAWERADAATRGCVLKELNTALAPLAVQDLIQLSLAQLPNHNLECVGYRLNAGTTNNSYGIRVRDTEPVTWYEYEPSDNAGLVFETQRFNNDIEPEHLAALSIKTLLGHTSALYNSVQNSNWVIHDVMKFMSNYVEMESIEHSVGL